MGRREEGIEDRDHLRRSKRGLGVHVEVEEWKGVEKRMCLGDGEYGGRTY
jgi:hypothetical protein